MSTKDALKELGAKPSEKESNCLPTDEACKKKEDAEAARAALAKKKAEDGKYKAKEYKAKKTSTGLECSMDGFVKMIKEMTEVALMGISLVKETLTSMAPESLSLAIKYLWDGMMGLGNWMGYALSAGYYIGLDLGVGDTVCEVFGYGYYVIDGLHWIVDFAGSSEKDGSKPSELPKKDPKQVAAAAAKVAADAAKKKADAKK